MKQINSVQEWLPLQRILENGMVQLKNNSYIKIIKVKPINFNLKSEFEKEVILNSYKTFFKTCNFDMQILIQSSKEDLTTHISNIKEQEKKESNAIQEVAENYIQYIKQLNKNKKSSNKNFYIILKKSKENEIEKPENILIEELNDNYFKIKECLAKCGNIVTEVSSKKETKEIIFSFLNKRIYLKK